MYTRDQITMIKCGRQQQLHWPSATATLAVSNSYIAIGITGRASSHFPAQEQLVHIASHCLAIAGAASSYLLITVGTASSHFLAITGTASSHCLAIEGTASSHYPEQEQLVHIIHHITKPTREQLVHIIQRTNSYIKLPSNYRNS